MARELLLRKQSTSHNPLCTSYRVDQPSYRFTLESCDEGVDATIKDSNGNLIASVKDGSPAIVSRVGSYNVCINGNGSGALYVEWTSDTYVDQQCCNEVRKELVQMIDDAVEEVERKIPKSNTVVRAGTNVEVEQSGNIYTVSATDTVTTLQQGDNIQITRSQNSYTIAAKVPTVVAGENVTVERGTTPDGSPLYEISSSDTKPDVTKAYVDEKIAEVSDKDTVTTILAGDNVTVTDRGTGGNHKYTISATDTKPDVTRAYVDEQIAQIGDNDTVTTLIAGSNVTIRDNGTGGNHTYTVSAVDTKPDVTKAYVDQKIAEVTGSETILTAGNNVTITDSGTGNNHNYRVSATSDVSKSYVDQQLAAKADKTELQNNYATKTELQTGLNDKLDKDSYDDLDQIDADYIQNVCTDLKFHGWYGTSGGSQNGYVSLSQLTALVGTCGLNPQPTCKSPFDNYSKNVWIAGGLTGRAASFTNVVLEEVGSGVYMAVYHSPTFTFAKGSGTLVQTPDRESEYVGENSIEIVNDTNCGQIVELENNIYMQKVATNWNYSILAASTITDDSQTVNNPTQEQLTQFYLNTMNPTWNSRNFDNSVAFASFHAQEPYVYSGCWNSEEGWTQQPWTDPQLAPLTGKSLWNKRVSIPANSSRTFYFQIWIIFSSRDFNGSPAVTQINNTGSIAPNSTINIRRYKNLYF